MPTPAAKVVQALQCAGSHHARHTDRSWTAFKSDEALKKILGRVFDLKDYAHTHIWNACDEGKLVTAEATAKLITPRLE